MGELSRRDHDDLDTLLRAMADPDTPAAACGELAGALRVAFAAHTAARETALRRVVASNRAPALLRAIVATIFGDHRDQERMIAALATLPPGTGAWRSLAIELRARVVRHAAREASLAGTIRRGETPQPVVIAPPCS